MKTIDLNHDWLFTLEDDLSYSTESIRAGEQITLPHSWNHTDGQGSSEEYHRGRCWYQRKLELTSEMLEKQLFLEIGAAGKIGHVYVNGHLAGSSRCGYAMFRVHLNPYLQTGSNLLSIAVDNRHTPDVYPLMADFTFYGGLYREVKLLVMEDLHFDVEDGGRDGIFLTSEKLSGDTFELQIRGSIMNRLPTARTGTLRVQLLDRDGRIVLETSSQMKMAGRTEFVLRENIADPFRWDGVDDPYLYTVNLSLIVDGKIYDQRSVEHGFRTIEVSAERGLFLNGRPVKLKGVSRHQDYAGVGNAISREHMEEDMAIIREMGANSIRLAHYQHDDYFYTLCDRYGLLVWAEIPYISIPSSTDPDSLNAKEQLERLIKQAYNHSSIYCWGVQNEITIGVENELTYDMIRQLHDLAKQLDRYRLTAQANIYSVENDSIINRLTDLIGYNLYYGWYYGELEDLGKRLDEFHTIRPDTPLILSEYGVDANPKYHTYVPAAKDYTEEYQVKFHQNAIKTMNERPFVLGGYVWNMFDFGSANRDEGGERGKNQKGLVTIDRKIRKDAYYLYKAHWSKEPFVHFAGRRFVNRHKRLNDILIFSNLEHMTVYHNGQLLAEIRSDDPVKSVQAVMLSEGDNHLLVEAYDAKGNLYRDEMTLRLVEERDERYVYQPPEENKHVRNWFEKFDSSNVPEIEFREGYYSINDTIDELYRNSQAREIFEKYFGNMAENPRFVPMTSVMSIVKMSKISALKIPKELVAVINDELNKIKKL